MKVKLAADVHGNYAALSAGLGPDDLFIGLGDYINLVDHRSLDGILTDLLGRETVAVTLDALAKGDKQQARASMGRIAAEHPDLNAQIMARVKLAYTELIRAIPCRAYLLWGNVDVPELLRQALQGQQRIVLADRLTLTLGQARVGLLSGTPPGPFSFGLPGERPLREYANLLYNLGSVDVLFVHPPPADPELSFDVHADRDEEGSSALSAYIERVTPGQVYFGHVHQPRLARKQIDSTLCVNVGHFRASGALTEIEL